MRILSFSLVAALLVGLAAAPAAAATLDPFDEANNTFQRLHQIPGAKTWTTGSPSAIIAVVDTGVTANADLPAERIVPGYDFVDGDDDASDPDRVGGTLVASVVASESGNGVGASGVCPQCRIMPVRVLRRVAGANLLDYVANVAAGIVWATDHGAKVIIYSYGVISTDPRLAAAIDHAVAKDVLVVAPAGTGATGPVYPAALDSVLAVGGVSSLSGVPTRNQTNFNTPDNRWIDVSAIQFGYATNALYTTNMGTNYTSAAIVAGAAGLAYSIRPDLTAAELRQKIVATASPIPGQPDYYPPVLDAARLLAAVGASDTAGPVITGTGVRDGQLIGPNTGPAIKPVVSEDHVVERTEARLDGALIGEWRPWTLESYLVRLPAQAGADGPHQLTVRAYDYGGNVAEKKTTVVFDSTPPDARIVQPAAEERVRSGTTVVVTAGESDLAVTLNGEDMVPAGDGRWTGQVTSSSLQVELRDMAGNRTVLTRPVVLDDSGPTATALMPAANARVRGTFPSTIYGVQDPGGVAYAQLWANGGYVGADYAYPYGLSVKTGTRSGTVTLLWKLTDKLGNQRSYTRYVVADNTAPTVSITSAPKNKAKVKGTAKVYVKASDWSGIARVQLLVNGKAIATDSTAPYVFSVKVTKTTKVQVRAYDKVGNVRYTTTRTWYRK